MTAMAHRSHAFMLVNNGLLYVALQHLDELAFLVPTDSTGGGGCH